MKFNLWIFNCAYVIILFTGNNNADDVNLIGDDIRTIERNSDGLLNAWKDIGSAVKPGKTKYMEIGCNRGMIVNEQWE